MLPRADPRDVLIVRKRPARIDERERLHAEEVDRCRRMAEHAAPYGQRHSASTVPSTVAPTAMRFAW